MHTDAAGMTASEYASARGHRTCAMLLDEVVELVQAQAPASFFSCDDGTIALAVDGPAAAMKAAEAEVAAKISLMKDDLFRQMATGTTLLKFPRTSVGGPRKRLFWLDPHRGAIHWAKNAAAAARTAQSGK